MPFLIVSLGASALLVGLVLLAHLLKPEISPRWRMLSELAIGRWGVVMNMAFISWAASNMALAVALWPLVPAWAAALLIVVSIGPLGAAFFVADPITTPPEQASTTGRWHTVFGVLFILGFPIVVALLAISAMATGSPLWPWFVGMGLLVWACLAVFMVLVARWRRECRPLGPEMPIGLPNRLFAAAYVAWTVVIALAAWPLLG
jgi:Protein of unknown function (DUF998)